MKDRPWGDAREAEWLALNQGGWEYLLPDGRDAHWLCVDTLEGSTAAFLARLCRELHVVPAHPIGAAAIEAKLALLGVRNVRVHADGLPAATPDGRPFDGFVLHDLRSAIDEPKRRWLLEAARAAVSREGFIYVAARNRYGYTRLRSGENASSSRARPGSILQQLGRPQATVYPFISDEHGRLLEVIAPTGYVSAKNPTRAGERLRRLALGPLTARGFSPAFGIVACANGAPPTQLDAILREAIERGVLPRGATFKRYHVLRGGKVIVSLGAPGRGFGQVIAVLTRGAQAIARREREFAILGRLGALPEPIARFVPRPLYRSEAAGTPAYLMQEFPGVTLDAPVPQLASATREAAAFLERLHLATRKQVTVDEPVFERLCEPMLKAGEERYPMLAPSFALIRAAMREAMIGAQLPIVWMHGDFKVENIIVNPWTSQLLGAIDWEHTEPEGLPCLDLWYLLLYNRQIRTGMHFFPAVEDLMAPDGLEPDEAELAEAYVSALDIPEAAIRPLVGALMVHHCSRRLLYDHRDEAMMDLIGSTIEACARWIGAPGKGKRRDAR